jgi:hypothetical protein
VAEVYCNGKTVAFSENGFLPFGAALDGHLRHGEENVIAVMCDNSFAKDTDFGGDRKKVCRFIAIVQKVLIQRQDIRNMVEHGVPLIHFGVDRAVATHEAGARRHANGHLAIGALKQQALVGQSIYIGRLNLCCAIAAELRPQIVNRYKKNIGLTSNGLKCGEHQDQTEHRFCFSCRHLIIHLLVRRPARDRAYFLLIHFDLELHERIGFRISRDPMDRSLESVGRW